MAIRFSGNIEDLRSVLDELLKEGEWTEINKNQHQFRHKNGGVLNWYPSTGAINFQGQPAGRDALQQRVIGKTKGSGVFSRSSRREGRADVGLISSLLPQRASRDFR
jgi:hypothetical protein